MHNIHNTYFPTIIFQRTSPDHFVEAMLFLRFTFLFTVKLLVFCITVLIKLDKYNSTN